MNLDHFFSIGGAHVTQGNPCEDYALSGALQDGTAYGVVTDGCSGVNANTDVGARALAWAFKNALGRRQVEAGRWFGLGFQELLQDTFTSYQYGSASRDDYLATVVGFAATAEQASVYVHGDGAIALRYADGHSALIEFIWANNAPFYLSYQCHPDLLRGFIALHQGSGCKPLCQRTTTFGPSGDGLEILETQELAFGIDDVRFGHVLHFRPQAQGIVGLAVLTDGVSQVKGKSSVEVARDCMAFKNHQGEFVKRRMLRALKTWSKDGCSPQDDLGIAAVWFGGKE